MPTNLPVPQHMTAFKEEPISTSQLQPKCWKSVCVCVCVCDIFAFWSQGPTALIISFPVTLINVISSLINLFVNLYE